MGHTSQNTIPGCQQVRTLSEQLASNSSDCSLLTVPVHWSPNLFICYMCIAVAAHVVIFHASNHCHVTIPSYPLQISSAVQAYTVPWLSQKYTSYAKYVLQNRQLFNRFKLNPIYAQTAA